MAIFNDECKCGTKVVVRTGKDASCSLRRDGKQLVYQDEIPSDSIRNYSGFRCRNCLEPLSHSVGKFKYETALN